MNNGIKFLIGATAAGLLYSYLNRKKAALENVEIKSIDVYIDDKKTTENFYLKLFYTLKLDLYNSANVGINIKSIDANFFVNGINFGNISTNINQTIAPKSTKKFEFNASISTGNVIASILDLISEGSAKIEVQGTMLTDLGLIEFKESKIV